jgi:ribonuclease HI
MVYIMRFYVDGGCRGNGSASSIGAAAAVMKKRFNGSEIWTRELPSDWNDPPTNQQAEITAIIVALQVALEKYRKLDGNPRVDLEIFSDSKYAIGCMTNWIYKWSRNGWMNAAGNPVANQDLIREASDLDDDLRELGSVTYTWIPRSENQEADKACNDVLDQM